MEISLVIVNWNSVACLRDCLVSLVRRCQLGNVETIVVDNGSFDGSARMIAAEFGWVRFVQLDRNLGFARANNLGASVAQGDCLVFLNPDTLLREDSLAALRSRLGADPAIGAVGCRLLNRDGTVQTSCVQSFPTVLNQLLDSRWLRGLFPRAALWGNAILHARPARLARVEAVSGACLAVRREAFAAVGGFSEDYFMYGEDLDLCRKLHRAGWQVVFTPETSLVHLGGESSKQAPGDFSVLMLRQSVHHFLAVHNGPASARAYRVAMGASALLRLALIGPAMLFGDRIVRHGAASRRKWRAVLRWSLGLAAARPRPAALQPAISIR